MSEASFSGDQNSKKGKLSDKNTKRKADSSREKGVNIQVAKDKEVILDSLSPITIKLVPDYDMRDLVLFSGNSVLWLLGKIINPAGGILYASENFKELIK
ncbi:hypothetical protein TQ32_02745 [Pyrococcus kukulkanii]|uniref:Uncharacterized protein n=1 Tax=Pyrococcus kukulkanii TaxID=1609559 RepID=A0A127B8B1_9EURY|nr:hypothetical protein TQ32_02745 [Pyrococcus kukulkanii]